jgi:hypothetical protein
VILSGQFEDLRSELLGAFTHQSSPIPLSGCRFLLMLTQLGMTPARNTVGNKGNNQPSIEHDCRV